MSWLWGLWNFFWMLALIIALASPFETLGWWAGWSRRADRPGEELPSSPADPAPPEAVFVVYLTGVAGFSGAFLARRERGFLDRIKARIPEAIMIDNVFPYSATNNPLDGDRLLRWLWVFLQRWRLKIPNNVFDLLIVMRNIGQTMVSADPRYGPIYNLGVARELAQSLLRHGYPASSGKPLHFVAYSGGAQIAVGVAPYLRESLGARVRIISLGGVLTDDPGIESVEHLTDFRGTRDHFMPRVGMLCPGRWRPVVFSSWNRARREGRLKFRVGGPMSHIGSRDYFSAKAFLPDGTSHADHCSALVCRTIVSPY